jgi:two-component system OmpR family response regulator
MQVIPTGLRETYKVVGLSFLLIFRSECRMRILIVEDDPVLSDGLMRSLRASDYAVDRAADGGEADHVLTAQNYDLVILDIGLPKLDGYEVLRRLRRRGSKTPVLFLTARDGLDDRVRGLDLGGDDYLAKPFDLPELEARVRALIRRGQSGGGSLLVHGALTLDTAGRRAMLNGERLELSARELGVLEVLMLRSGRVVNKDQLAEQLYGWDEEVGPNAIEVYVHRLRRKLEPAGVTIRTIRGLGYLLEKPGPLQA